MKELYDQFGKDSLSQMQAIFASIFVLQNRIQTAYEKDVALLTSIDKITSIFCAKLQKASSH